MKRHLHLGIKQVNDLIKIASRFVNRTNILADRQLHQWTIVSAGGDGASAGGVN